MENHTILLPNKPSTPLTYSLYTPPPSSPLSSHLLLFLNGLILPRSSWSPTISHLFSSHPPLHLPTILTYDRYGQGDSSPVPPSSSPSTAKTIITDLHNLLSLLSLQTHNLIIIASSIGCPLARLYCTCTTYTPPPPKLSALVFLDSMMANTDFVSIFPNPDSPNFDPDTLPENISPNDLRHARAMFGQYFHPTVPNSEGFDRSNLAELLPYADKPLLPYDSKGNRPHLIVVGHDPDEFAEQCETGSLSVSKAVINTYMKPVWDRYNQGLTLLVAGPENNNPHQVKIAKGCGHFIPRDDPKFVANEIKNLLDKLIK
ncbi:Alpha/Beta hydrolase protein [Podospora fimiseda]|uniref:Alpha/Beta hydrolase protein n=1 Tax=Podospora fimiseda TaxID=252190 RepID=A0AAN7C0A4_9PEZI|nr:Alpha/Beta hydrolase protein [Podospora fimiseda]